MTAAAVQTFGIDLAKLARGFANGRYSIVDDELHKRCSKCREYWPADREFWYPSISTACRLHTYCKACYLEVRYPNGRPSAAKAAAEPPPTLQEHVP